LPGPSAANGQGGYRTAVSETSLALEAARLQGGAKACEALRRLLQQGHSAELPNLASLAAQAGLNVEQFMADLHSETARQRVLDDIRLAAELGVHYGPAVFLNGRRVPDLCLTSPAFWGAVAGDASGQRTLGRPAPTFLAGTWSSESRVPPRAGRQISLAADPRFAFEAPRYGETEVLTPMLTWAKPESAFTEHRMHKPAATSSRDRSASHAPRPRRRDGLTVHEVDGELLLFDLESAETHRLNETAYFVWEQCDGSTEPRQIAEALVETYEVQLSTATDHVEQILADFRHHGLVIMVD
jgi:hypothetical protein